MQERKLTRIASPCPYWSEFVIQSVRDNLSSPLYSALCRGSSVLAKLPNGAIQWHWESQYTDDLVLVRNCHYSIAAAFEGVTTKPLDSLVLWRGKCLVEIIECGEKAA